MRRSAGIGRVFSAIVLTVHHLVDNAMKFAQEGKKVIIHINCSRQEGIAIDHPAVVRGKNYDVITISDNGHGFNPNHARDIFTMFYRETGTNNRKGSGMGIGHLQKDHGYSWVFHPGGKYPRKWLCL